MTGFVRFADVPSRRGPRWALDLRRTAWSSQVSTCVPSLCCLCSCLSTAFARHGADTALLGLPSALATQLRLILSLGCFPFRRSAASAAPLTMPSPLPSHSAVPDSATLPQKCTHTDSAPLTRCCRLHSAATDCQSADPHALVQCCLSQCCLSQCCLTVLPSPSPLPSQQTDSCWICLHIKKKALIPLQLSFNTLRATL